jgi:membrane-associated protease RseP (regulator of RpoE activity)
MTSVYINTAKYQEPSQEVLSWIEFWSEGLAFFLVGITAGVFFHEYLHYFAARKYGEASIDWVNLETEYAVPRRYEAYVRRAPITLGIFGLGLSLATLSVVVAFTPVPRSSLVLSVAPWIPCIFFGLPADLRVPDREEVESG